VFINVPTSTLPNVCDIDVIGPGGSTADSGCLLVGGGFMDVTTLTATGTYTARIHEAGIGTGTYTLRVISVHDQALTTTIGGPPVTATIAEPGAVSRVTFHGRAGQRVTVGLSGATLPTECDDETLVGPTGSASGRRACRAVPAPSGRSHCPPTATTRSSSIRPAPRPARSPWPSPHGDRPAAAVSCPISVGKSGVEAQKRDAFGAERGTSRTWIGCCGSSIVAQHRGVEPPRLATQGSRGLSRHRTGRVMQEGNEVGDVDAAEAAQGADGLQPASGSGMCQPAGEHRQVDGAAGLAEAGNHTGARVVAAITAR